MKIQSKIPKVQKHENLQKKVYDFYAIFHEFYGGQLKQQICYSLTLLISYDF